MIRLLLLIALFISPYIITESSAQSLAGGEIYYELISAKKYLITAHIYRMCDKASLTSISAYVYGGNLVEPMNFQRIAISKINDTCGNPCNVLNKPSNAGFEKHTFTDTVDFNLAPYNAFVSKGICAVSFGIRKSGRPSSLTTLPSGIFYIDAAVNLCISNTIKNSSPQFSMEPKFFVPCNMPLTYSPGLLDTMDNDSVSFSLAEVQSDYNTGVQYNGSFSSQIPMSPFCLPPGVVTCQALPNAKPPRGFSLDVNTGMTYFTPSTCDEVGVIKYMVNEYRFNINRQRYEWLGYVTREMVVQVFKSPGNNPPDIPTVSNLKLCEGNKVCFNIKTTDIKTISQTKDDTTTLFWDAGIKDATFRITNPSAREKEGEFCWQMKKSNKKQESRFFTVAAYDKRCNMNLITKTFKIRVASIPHFIYKNTPGQCGEISWTSSINDSLYPNAIGSNITTIRSFSNNKVLYTGSGLNSSANIHENGKIIIEHRLSISGITCLTIVQDTLTVNNALELPDINENKDTIVCNNFKGIFHFKQSHVASLKNFQWYVNNKLVNQTDSIISVAINKNTSVELIIENASGCIAQRALQYNLKQHDAISTASKSVCMGDTVQVKANLKTMKMPVSYQWKVDGRDTAVNDSLINIVANKFMSVNLILTDADNCVFIDSVSNSLFLNFKFNLNYNSQVCRDSITSVKATIINGAKPFIYAWQLDHKDTLVNDSVFAFRVTKDKEVSLKIRDQNGCSYKDSISVQEINKPEASLNNSVQACYDSFATITPVIKVRTPQMAYQWIINKTVVGTDSFLYRKIKNGTLIRLKISNQQCSSENSITANLSYYSKNALAINRKSAYYLNEWIVLTTTKSFKSYLWFNGKTSATDSFPASDLGPAGKYKMWCKASDINGCEYHDTVEVYINDILSIKGLQQNEKLNLYPNPVTSILTVEAIENLTINLFSLDGKLLLDSELKTGTNNIDLTSLAAGVYFIKVTNNGKQSIYKVIKE